MPLDWAKRHHWQKSQGNSHQTPGLWRATPERGCMTGHFPPALWKGSNGGIIWFIKIDWNKFIAAIRASIKFRLVFYNFCYYFWGRHCCCAKSSIIGNVSLFFTSFHCPQLFHCPQCPTGVPVSLTRRLGMQKLQCRLDGYVYRGRQSREIERIHPPPTSSKNRLKTLCELDQCSSTFFVTVHP